MSCCSWTVNKILKKGDIKINFYIFYYYLAGCIMFPHLPAPIWQLYYLLPPVASVIPVFFINPLPPNSSLTASAQVRLRLPRFPLLDGLHFITSFGNLLSSIIWTCSYHWSCYIFIYLFPKTVPSVLTPHSNVCGNPHCGRPSCLHIWDKRWRELSKFYLSTNRCTSELS